MTDDLVFIWDPQMPLDINKNIELPQLELVSTKNQDCTTEYPTGKHRWNSHTKKSSHDRK